MVYSGKRVEKRTRKIAAITTVLAICMVMLSVFAAGLANGVRTGVVTDSVVGLNVRSGPGSNYSRLGIIYDGTTVTITGDAYSSDGSLWYAISFNGGTGYVISTYITIVVTPGADPEFEAYLAAQGFPESYWPGLKTLHAMYPNWVFKAFHTGHDWNYAVDQETVIGKSLVSSGSKSSWKSTDPKAYNWDTGVWTELDSGGWVAASREIVAYYMDPRNFLTQNSVFQFLLQSYDPAAQTVAGVEQLVAGTFLAGSVTDVDGTPIYYPQAIFNAGAQVGVSPYVLAAMIIQEMGASGASGSISGTHSVVPGYFNYYNIGAAAGGGNTAITNGLIYASGGRDGTGTSYGRPWNTRMKALVGGAQFYADSYVAAGQNTMYLKRFNVQGSNPFTHQYMTSVWGANSEGVSLAGGYNEAQRAAPLVFSIPVYTNMPATACAQPVGDGSPDNRLSGLSVGGYPLTPGFDMYTNAYSVVVPYGASSIQVSATTVNGAAAVSGTGTIPLNVGSNTVNLTVTAQNGSQRVITLTIARQADTGAFSMAPLYPVSANKLVSGIALGTTVDTLVANLRVTGGYVYVYAGNNMKAGGSAVCTGDQVYIYSDNQDLYDLWTVVLYGDVNGDGSVSNTDRVKIRNHILATQPLSGLNFTAADVNRDGQVTNTDRVLVRNQILGGTPITQ